MLRTAVIVLVAVLFVGCSSSSEGGTEVENPTLILFVSNQSFDDDTVDLTVTIDGDEVVDDRFQVNNQHTWVEYKLAPDPGEHEVVATSSTGIELKGTVDIPEAGPLYAVIEYWYYEEDLDREITLRVQDRPFQFD